MGRLPAKSVGKPAWDYSAHSSKEIGRGLWRGRPRTAAILLIFPSENASCYLRLCTNISQRGGGIRSLFREYCTHISHSWNYTNSRVRSLCFLRLAEVFEKYSNFDFSAYNERMWKGIKRSIALLPQFTNSAENAPSLFPDVCFSCLSQSDSNAVFEAVLTLIENRIWLKFEEGGILAYQKLL
jgi:hypothetical protein